RYNTFKTNRRTARTYLSYHEVLAWVSHRTKQEIEEFDMAWFPFDHEKGGASGSLVKSNELYKPSDKGVVVYFSSEDVNIEISRVKAAGGQMLQEKTLITEDIGYMALFLDTEGNRIALHSQK
ncbi:VOC family protein, partial [Mongoliibacter ruber]